MAAPPRNPPPKAPPGPASAAPGAPAQPRQAPAKPAWPGAATPAPPPPPDPVALAADIQRATALQAAGNHAAAEPFWLRVLAADPGHAGAMHGLGLAARLRGERAVALRWLKQAADTAPGQLPHQVELANELRADGRFAEAEAAYRRALRLEEENPTVLAGLGHCARARGEGAVALGWFRRAADAAPRQPALQVEFGTELRNVRRLPQAEAAFRRALMVDADYHPAIIGLALCARAAGDSGMAIARFRQAAEAAPWHLGTLIELGTELRGAGRNEEAEEAYRRVLATDPGNPGACIGLGLVARARGDSAAALAAFEAVCRAAPRHAGAQMQLGTELRMLGRLDEAEAAFGRALALEPANPAALAGLGHCARARGNSGGAAEWFRRAVAATPANPRLRFELGTELRLLGRVAEAEVEFRAGLEQDPRSAGCMIGLGLCARARSDRAAALDWFERAAATGDAAWLLQAAAAFRQVSAHARAAEVLAPLLRPGAEEARAWASIGLTERAASRPEASLQAFRRAVELAPNDPATLVELGIETRNAARPGEAARLFRQALEHRPRFAPALLQLALQARLAADGDEALRLLREAAEAHPHDQVVAMELAQLLGEAGELEAALAVVDGWEAAHVSTAETRVRRIDLLRRAGLLPEALALARRHLAEAPEQFWVWSLRFRLELLLGNIAEAEACLDAARPVNDAEAGHVALCRALLAAEDWRLDEAAPACREAISIHPADNGARLQLAQLQMLRLETREARQLLKDAHRRDAAAALLRGASPHYSQGFYGPILDDFELDAAALAELRALRGTPQAAAVAPLLDIARRFPDSTAAAVTTLLALARAGLIATREPPPPRPDDATIPRTIAQYWNTKDLPPDVAALTRTWAEMNPGYVHTVHDDESALALIREEFGAPLADRFARIRVPAQRADVFRTVLLLSRGGFYADADDRCLAPLDGFARTGTGFVGFHEDLGSLGNNFLGCAPGHPLLRRAFDMASSAMLRRDPDGIWLATGPGMFSRAFVAELAAAPLPPAEWLAGVTILHRSVLRRHVAFHCGAAYKLKGEHWVQARTGRTRKPAAEAPRRARALRRPPPAG